MGTTKTQIQGGGGQLAYTLLIGGYPKVLTTWGDTSAVTTAIAAGDWTSVIAGLEPPGEVRQSIKPFRPNMDSDGVTFVVKPDANDTFAIDVHGTDLSTGARTRLTASIDNNDSTSIAVNATGDFASSGTIYIGTEAGVYTGKSASAFTTVTRGKYEPFGIEGSTYHFGRQHRINTVAGGQAGFPAVTDFPRTWIGRSVACYCHRVVDGVLDVLAQAELVFAGHIAAITDSESGAQHIACEDMRDYVANSILLGDQWSALPPEGAYLPSTEYITVHEWGYNQTTDVPEFLGTAATLPVGGTYNGNTYLSAGLNTAQDIIDGINDFLEEAINTTGDLISAWRLTTVGANRAEFTATYTTTSTQSVTLNTYILMTDGIAGMLGFPIEGTSRTSAPGHPLKYTAVETSDDPTVSYAGSFAIGHSMLFTANATTVTISGETGTFVSQGDLIPEPWKSQYTTTTGTWGFVTIRDYLFLAKQVTATTYTLYLDRDMVRALQRDEPSARAASDNFYGVGLYDDMYIRTDEPIPRLKQVIIAHEPDFDEWLRKTFYSTGVVNYNESSNGYDAYDRQLGLAIPYGLLGSAFEVSCTELAARSLDQGITIMIDRPTKFVDLLLPELLLRNAHLIQSGSSLVFVVPGVTTGAASTHTLTESSKADPSDITQTRVEREDAPITHAKVEYDRDPRGTYYQTTEIINEQARTDHGRGEVLTIEARNSFSFASISAADAVRDAVTDLSAHIQAFWARALPVINRTLKAGIPGATEHWFINPGDTVSITDSFVRDPFTGQRGVTAVPGWCLSITRDWKLNSAGMRAVIDVALHASERTRRALYSPAMKVDETGPGGSDAGYDNAGPYLYVKANEFSLLQQDDDITNFDAGDEITIVEKSPTTPGSPTKWTRTIDAISAGSQRITLSATLSSPAWDNTLEYYIFSQPYGSAQTSQQIHSYIGDDADDKVVDTVDVYLWGQQEFGASPTTKLDATEQHEYPVTDGTWDSDGAPCTLPGHRNAVLTTANLVNRRTAPHGPQILETAAQTTSTGYVLALAPFPFYIGNLELNSTFSRSITVGPIMWVTSTATGTLRVTSSSLPPAATDSANDLTVVQFLGAVAQTEWTTTATSYTNQAANTVPIIPASGRPFTWITVEFKTSSDVVGHNFQGFHEFWITKLGG